MAEYRFIENIRDYFNPGYFTDEFGKKVAEEAGLGAKDLKAIDEQFGKLSELYRQYKNKIVNGNLVPKYKIEETHHFHTDLLKLLGYKASTPYQEWLYLDDTSVVPVRHIYREGAKCTLLIMEMQTLMAFSVSITMRKTYPMCESNAIVSASGKRLSPHKYLKIAKSVRPS